MEQLALVIKQDGKYLGFTGLGGGSAGGGVYENMDALLASPVRRLGVPVYVIDIDAFLYWNGSSFVKKTGSATIGVPTIDGGSPTSKPLFEINGGNALGV